MSSCEDFLAALREWAEVFMRRSMQNFIRSARSSGVSMPQVNLMFHVKRLGASGVSDIGEELGITSAAASQLVDRLVQQGYLLRSEDPQDRRLKQITLSPAGVEMLQSAIRARQEWQDRLGQALSPAEQVQVTAALRLLTERADQLDSLPPQPPCSS